MNILKNKSLSTHFAIMTSIVILTTVILMSTYNMYIGKGLAELNNIEKSSSNKVISSLIVEIAKDNIDHNNFQNLQNVTKNLVVNNVISYVNIIKANDKTIVWSSIPNLMNQKKSINEEYVVDTISVNSSKYQIITAFKNKNLINMSINTMLNNNKILALLFIFLGFASSFIMSKSVTNPINHLAKGTEELSKGNLKYTIEVTEFKEINLLVNAFNEMAEKLDQSYSFLEQKVKDRTEEILKKRQELEHAYKELKEAQSMMVHSEKMRSLGELVAGITHEINNPVNFIYGNLVHLDTYSKDLTKTINILIEYKSKLPEEDQKIIDDLLEKIEYDFIRDDLPELIKSCKNGAERTKNIILELKSFSRLNEMVINELNINQEIDTILNILQSKYKNKITVHKEYEEIPLIESYGGQVNQVFMNILDNAAYAIKDRGDVFIRTKLENNSVIIEFEDNGVGIEEHNLAKVFDPFYTTKPVGQGTGLGMSISYKVIKNHNGDIKIFSEVGKGTKFVVKLPIKGLKNDEDNRLG